MIRVSLVLSALALLAACGDATSGDDAAARAPAKPKIDPARVIHGEVYAPEGQSLEGATVMACLTPRETCVQEAEAPLTVVDGVGRYELVVPQAGAYHLTVWKDVNANSTPDVGDLLAFAHNMEAVPSGQRLTPMTAFVRREGAMTTNAGGKPMGSAVQLAAAAAAVRAGGLGGIWSQRSSGSELVWGPEIKFQAASATVGFGTNLGGTFGSGSPTNTTIVYSYKPMQVSRTMALDVQPDGAFHWTAVQERRQGKCRSVRQEKFGRVQVEGDQITFVVADARQSCGGGAQETVELKDETYTLGRTDTGFRLTGDKGINWAFTRG